MLLQYRGTYCRLAIADPPPIDSFRLALAGYGLAVVLPPAGFFIGLALLVKGRRGHGVAIMCLAVSILYAIANINW